MATTNRFGLEAFGPEGQLADNGYKFTLRDRQTIDSLLWTLFNHDHREVGTVTPFLGPQGRPVLTRSAIGGVLGAGSTLYYRISFMDQNGNETEASISSLITTPAPIAPPVTPFLEASTTGGSLDDAGIYRYALAYYQTGNKTTRAPNTASITLPTTLTGSITIELPTLPSDADGWHVYRRDPLSDDYYYLTAVAGPATEFVDDGSYSPDCTRKRPTTNNTNNTNSVLIEIDPNDLFLDSRVTAWRIYRSNNGIFSASSLLATVTDTVTEGGTDLVTEYTDIGSATTTGVPLSASTIPPPIPTLDIADAFADSEDGSYLPANLAPQGVSQFYTFLPGALADATVYNQLEPLHDMRVHRVDVFALTAPTGADGSNYASVLVKSDATQNAIQSVWTDSEPVYAELAVATDASSGTFTLLSGVQETSAIDYDATASEVAAALEALSNITAVFVSGSGVADDPWLIRFLDPVVPDTMTADGTNLSGGQPSIVTFGMTVAGSEGGTFTLGLDTEITAAIAVDASAGDVATALEALTNITDVTVTGTGTEIDPWLVEFVNPGSQPVPIMYADASSATGSVFIAHVQDGFAATTIEVPLSGTGQTFEYVPGNTDTVMLEAEDSTDHDGDEISDLAALNDVVLELLNPGEAVRWNPGVLAAGNYRFRAHVAAPSDDTELLLKVSDLDAGGTGSGDMKTVQFVINRTAYLPAIDIYFSTTGVENIELSAELGSNGSSLRVDRLGYQPSLPTLRGGSTVTVEVAVTGTPSTPGSDVQLNVWY